MPYMNRISGVLCVAAFALACGKAGQTRGDNAPTSGMGPTGLPAVTGEPDMSVDTALPPVPRIQRVSASTVGDSVNIDFQPIDGARDYRVYELPSDSDISVGKDGLVSIQNAIYRCAGDRQSPSLDADTDPGKLKQSELVTTFVEGMDVKGYKRTLEEATLGYVYANPGPGRVPVYSMGDPNRDSDNTCYHQRWAETRVKHYTTSEEQRTQMLQDRWRDDGIVFYVPAAASDATRPLYKSGDETSADWKRGAGSLFYLVDGPEAQQRGDGVPIFNIGSSKDAEDAVPLMRVYYANFCGNSHDELAAGTSRFERARRQGAQLPMFNLHWSGITEPTTLVVEALDQGCPFVDPLAAASRDAGTEDDIPYPAFKSIADVQAASATGEVFINGQHEAKNTPKAIARSFIKVSPGPKPDLDWFAGFGPEENLPDFTTAAFADPCEDPDSLPCWREYREKSTFADLSFVTVTPNRSTVGVVKGELWVTYADVGADLGGKFRLTPNVKATMAADSYLHVTMEVDNFTTARRYAQVLISDGNVPVQWNLPKSNTIILQSFPDKGTGNWPFLNTLEICDHRAWDVNDQCPTAQLNKITQADGKQTVTAAPEASEQSGVDHSTRFDYFLSTKRVYVFSENAPYGCIDLPTAGVPSGEVTVTFGDVLYHSGVDAVFAFHETHQKIWAKRHFDNLGFKSGVPGPGWDEKRFPCLGANEIMK
jgi:hypothetical protein